MRRAKRKLYKGELEQQHGKAEAAAFIKKNKYIEGTDAQGDTYYVKNFDEEISEKEIETSAAASASAPGPASARRLRYFLQRASGPA